MRDEDSTFQLHTPCKNCSSGGMECSMVLPCSNCIGEERMCIASNLEIPSRVRLLWSNIKTNVYEHNDHAKFQLYLQTNIYCPRSFIHRDEVSDIFQRLVRRDAECGVMNNCLFTMEGLPSPMKNMISLATCYKVEFMDHGRYNVVASPVYEANFMSVAAIFNACNSMKIPPKVIDFCMCSSLEQPYRMWVESLRLPGVVVGWNDLCIWRDIKELRYTVIHMMSMIVNNSCIITVTTLTAS